MTPRFLLLVFLILAACTPLTQTASNAAPRSVFSESHVLLAQDANLWSQRMRSLLPPGWTVSTRDDTILVQRDQPVRVLNGVNLPPFDSEEAARTWARDHAVTFSYEIWFTFQDKVPLPTYARLNAENAAFDKQRAQMKHDMGNIPHKFDSFMPETAEQRIRVAAYEKFLASYHPLPDFYCDDYSVSSPPDNGTLAIYDPPGADAECKIVKQRLLSLFHPYPEPPHRADRFYGDP